MSNQKWLKGFVNLTICAFAVTAFVADAPLTRVWADVGDATTQETQMQTTTYAPAPAAVQARRAAQTSAAADVAPSDVKKPGRGILDPNAWVEEFRSRLRHKSVRIQPRFRAQYTLDSNSILASKGEKSDSIFSESPGVSIFIPLKDHALTLDYDANFEQFANDTQDNFISQNASADLALNFKKLYISSREKITRTASRSGTTFTERIPRWDNSVDTIAGYKWNRLTLEGEHEYYKRKYNSSTPLVNRLDYYSNRFDGRVYYDLTSKIQVFPQYSLSLFRYPDSPNRDGMQQNLSGGVRGTLLPKTTLYGTFGFGRLDFDASNPSGTTRKRRPDAESFVSEVGAGWTPFRATTVDAGWTRSIQQSTYSDTNFYIENGIFLKWSQELSAKLIATAYVSFAKQDYEEQPATAGNGIFVNGIRKDDVFSTQGKLAYRMTDWLSWDVAYTYTERDSNASVFDYTDHLMSVGASVAI